MKKTINKEHIEGYLFEHKLEVKTCGPTSKTPGAQYIAGTLDVAVDEEGMNVLQTHFTFVSPTFGSGKTNNTYGVLQKIIESGKTFVEAGKDATKVSIDTALALNDFYTDGDEGLELVSAKRNEGGFVSIVSALNPNVDKRHTFQLDMVITKVTRIEANEERETPERVDIKGVIFDGFPRTIAQAEALNAMLAERGQAVSTVIGLEVDDAELIKRIIARGATSGRADDNEETAKKRLATYYSQTLPLKDFYINEGKYAKIQGVGTIDAIYAEIKKAIDAVK